MKTYEQNCKKYWCETVPMAEAAGIDPWLCVRYNDQQNFDEHPKFTGGYVYTFALTVLEGKPVFVGNEIWWNGEKFTVSVPIIPSGSTWTPPPKKRTFMLGDKELPCPLKSEPCADNLNYATLCNDGHEFYFESCEDKSKWRDAITDFLIASRDKE